jgi:hypothetical protein
MKGKPISLCVCTLFLLVLSTSSILGGNRVSSRYVADRVSRLITGIAANWKACVYNAGPSHAPNAARGNIIGHVGSTWYDCQHNGSMGRQIVYADGADFQGIHFLWRATEELGISSGYISYNAYDRTSKGNLWAGHPARCAIPAQGFIGGVPTEVDLRCDIVMRYRQKVG